MLRIASKNIHTSKIPVPLKQTPVLLVKRGVACDFYQDHFINI